MILKRTTIQTFVLMIVTGFAAVTSAQETAFTYQGELKQGDNLANGLFNMEFSLWNAGVGGSQIDTTVALNGVQVVDGQFSVELDFGAAAFDNSGRWLEIVVEGSRLLPRQPISRSPYSIQTRGIFVDENENVGIGTVVPDRQLDLESNQSIMRLFTTDSSPSVMSQIQLKTVDTGSFTPLGQVNFVDETDTTRASIIGSKTGTSSGQMTLTVTPTGFPQLSLSASSIRASADLNLVRPADGEISASIGVDGADSCLNLHGGNVGIGTSTPNYPLHVVSDTARSAIFGKTNSLGSFTTGVEGRTTTPNGTGVWGVATGDGIYGVFAESGAEIGRGIQAWAKSTRGVNYGVFALSNSPDGYDFYAAGNGINYGAPSSIRWKRNIEPVTDPLGKLAEIHGVYYDWDEEHGGGHDIGFIGEEVGKIVPEIVAYEADGEYVTGMDYGRMTPLLVEAVKALRVEHKTQITDLRTEQRKQLAEKDAQIIDLDNRLEQLEAIVQQLVEIKREPKQ